jgi:hypothetical protein
LVLFFRCFGHDSYRANFQLTTLASRGRVYDDAKQAEVAVVDALHSGTNAAERRKLDDDLFADIILDCYNRSRSHGKALERCRAMGLGYVHIGMVDLAFDELDRLAPQSDEDAGGRLQGMSERSRTPRPE